MNSIKAAEKRVAKRKQVFRPILDNPFTDEAHLWPAVSDHHDVLERFRLTVLQRLKQANEWSQGTSLEAPVDVVLGFNNVVEYCEHDGAGSGSDTTVDGFLFVCNKDGVPAVLLSQLPVLAYTSKRVVKVVQLPKNSLRLFDECLPQTKHDGLLLLLNNDKLDRSFATMLENKVGDLHPPWLQGIDYVSAPVKLLSTSVPLKGKSANKKQTQPDDKKKIRR